MKLHLVGIQHLFVIAIITAPIPGYSETIEPEPSTSAAGTVTVPETTSPSPSPPILTPEEFVVLQQRAVDNSNSRNTKKVLGISLAIHGITSVLHLLAWGVTALVDTLQGISHNDDDDYDQPGGSSSNDNDNDKLKSLDSSVFGTGVVGGPIVAVLALSISTPITTTLVNRSMWFSTSGLSIFGFGLLGVGCSTGLMWAMVATDSVPAFVIVTVLGNIILPPLFQTLGYKVGRKRTMDSRMTLPDSEAQPHLETTYIPPSPTIISGAGVFRPSPGLSFGTILF